MDLHKEVLKGFSIKSNNIKKIKGSYICNTQSGALIIKETREPISKIVENQKIINYLESFNIKTLDKYYNSITKTPYFIFRNDIYIMSDYVSFEKNNFSKECDFLETVKSLAIFHTSVKKTDLNLKIEKPLPETYKKNLKDLTEIKKRISRQNKMSDFDLTFIKNYKHYINDIEESIKIIDTPYFYKIYNESLNYNSVVHNLVKEENIFTLDNNIYINNFNEISIGIQLQDLGEIIQRHLKLTDESDIIDLDKILNTYSNVIFLTEEDKKIIKAIIKYPKRYVKTILNYYTKNRSWTPTSLNSKLDSELSRREKYANYIK